MTSRLPPAKVIRVVAPLGTTPDGQTRFQWALNIALRYRNWRVVGVAHVLDCQLDGGYTRETYTAVLERVRRGKEMIRTRFCRWCGKSRCRCGQRKPKP